jgi:hypothetical protein
MTSTTTADEELNQKDPLDHLIGVNHSKDLKSLYKDNNGKSKDEENKHSIVAHKYSNDRKGPLYESVILGGLPMFIKYEDGQVKVVPHIEEPSRIIRPPRKEDCPYLPYEFASLEEVQKFADASRIKSIESFYLKAKDIVLRYIDQEETIIIILAADIIWSYFQDLFATTHYVNVTGDNETGNSSIGYAYEYTGYRPVKASTISTANYYRTLGILEPGQCTMIEDEADNLEVDSNKLRNLKHTYKYNSKVPKVNMNAKDQNQNWFFGYCYKMIISEKPLDPAKDKALVERMLTFHCKPAVKDNLQSIKKITTNPPGDPDKQKLYKELMDFRKSMLCYRLTHYTEHIPDIDTGLKNRDEELEGPLLQIFRETKVFGDIKYALQKFLAQRKAGKQKTIESALGPLIVKLLTRGNTLKLLVGQVWNEATNTIPGRFNPENPNEYQTNEYGVLHRNTLFKKIEDAFGADRERKNNGVMLIFDEEKIRELKMMYAYEVQDKNKAKDAAPDANNESEKKVTDTLQLESEGSVGSEGSRVCGFIIEKTQE